MVLLGNKSVGDIVKIRENGSAVNYIIVQKGRPSSMYDSSCDGVWLLRQRAHSKRAWGTVANKNNYQNSSVKVWLNDTFLYSIDSKLRDAIKTVKIPYIKGVGNVSAPVQSGANGLSCKVFLLSGYEIGFTKSDNEYIPEDGAKLAGFPDNNSRICTDDSGNYVKWWLRSPSTYSDEYVKCVPTGGQFSNAGSNGSPSNTDIAVRPAFVLPSNLSVNSDGSVVTNSAPTITADKIGNLGTLTEGFVCNYSVNDVDTGDNVTVTLTMDSTTVKTFTAVKGQQYTYSLVGNDWLKTINGSHTFKISATDGKETVESAATFTRACSRLSTTLSTPLQADDVIKACTLKVVGAIPEDAVCAYEVTNNANDRTPVWEDCTEKVKNGSSHLFTNKTAVNGFAFNFRVSIQRGASNAGGYITQISGGFE